MGAVVAIGGIAVALDHYSIIPIHRIGGENRLVFRLDAPFGSVDLRAGAGTNDVATVETLAEQGDNHNPQWSYGLKNGSIGMLRIGIGTDEGMIAQPPIAMWETNSGFSPAVAYAPQPDWGAACPPSFFSFSMPSIPSGQGWYPQMRVVSTDAGTVIVPQAKASTRITLTKDLPMDIDANLGFGESTVDLTGLPITNASIETGASRVQVCCNAMNPVALHNCRVRAGIGPCTFCGLSNLNADNLNFHGALGSYQLGFEGKLAHNMDAIVDVGIGMCSITIPATACRVQVFYEDGIFSSFSFPGLAYRRPGYESSVGFERSNSPILTLHLSSGAGKISVNYH